MQEKKSILKKSFIQTPIGLLVAIADDHVLHLLEFADYRRLERQVNSVTQKQKATVISGHAPPLECIEQELDQYFKGKLTEFKTPLFFSGTPFQNHVWKTLQTIPYGQTQSYADVARTIGRPTAFRAVAQANSTNRLVIVVPCHRVINANGELGGYASGLLRKEWLIDCEKRQ